MSIQRPAYFRESTWEVLFPWLNGLSDDALRKLLTERPAAPVSDAHKLNHDELLEELLKRGGYLLVASGLINRPDITKGTVFSHGGIEYVFNHRAADAFAASEARIEVPRLGEKKTHAFRHSDLLRAIAESADFDQIGSNPYGS